MSHKGKPLPPLPPTLESLTSREDQQYKCDVCGDSDAEVFCVTCQKKLCEQHQEQEKEDLRRQGLVQHYRVELVDFLKNESNYIQSYCSNSDHTQNVLVFACKLCMKTFCAECLSGGITSLPCCAAGGNAGHDCGSTKEVYDSAKITAQYGVETFENIIKKCGKVKTQLSADLAAIEKMKAGLKDEIEKLAAAKIQEIEQEKVVLMEELDQVTASQVTSINEESEGVEQCQKRAAEYMQLTRHMLEQANISKEQFLEKYSLLRAQTDFQQALKDVPNSTNSRAVSCELSEDTNRLLGVTVEICADYEIMVDLPPPPPAKHCEITKLRYLRSTSGMPNSAFTAKFFGNEQIIIGGINYILIMDYNLNVLKKQTITGTCTSISKLKNKFIVFLYSQVNRQKSVQVYSSNLKFVRTLFKFSDEHHTQISLTATSVLAVDYANKLLRTFDMAAKKEGVTVKLAGMKLPMGVCAGNDSSYCYVSDCDERGCIRKYSLTEVNRFLWVSSPINSPTGIVETPDGYIYASSLSGQAVYKLSTKGELLQTILSDDFNDATWDLSIQGSHLLLATENDDQFELQYFQLEHCL